MKLGLKLYTDSLNLIDKFSKEFDFFEVFITSEFDISKLKRYKEEITIHTAHIEQGFDIGSLANYNLNKELLGRVIEAANIVSSKFIVLHPGMTKEKDSAVNMIKFLQENYDERILIENCPVKSKMSGVGNHLFSSPEEMKELLEKTNLRLCFDVPHAVCAANTLSRDPDEVINKFFLLNPPYFHISGSNPLLEYDEHKHLFERNNKLSILSKASEESYCLFETGFPSKFSIEDVKKDNDIIRKIISQK